MKAVAGVALVAALAVVWYLRRAEPSAAAPATHAPGAPAATAGAPHAAKPPQHATRITPQERREVAERIAQAQASRASAGAAVSAPARPTLPAPKLDPEDLDTFKTTIRSAMKEVIPMIAECYDKAGSAVPDELTVRAHLTLTGDPDVGTLVDATSATDNHEAALPAGFDDCLRSTLQTIELPPLAEGNAVTVTYPFVFRRD